MSGSLSRAFSLAPDAFVVSCRSRAADPPQPLLTSARSGLPEKWRGVGAAVRAAWDSGCGARPAPRRGGERRPRAAGLLGWAGTGLQALDPCGAPPSPGRRYPSPRPVLVGRTLARERLWRGPGAAAAESWTQRLGLRCPQWAGDAASRRWWSRGPTPLRIWGPEVLFSSDSHFGVLETSPQRCSSR